MSRDQSSVQIRELEEAAKLSRPNVIVGIPETGLVGIIAASYLVDRLALPEIAHVESELLPQMVVVQFRAQGAHSNLRQGHARDCRF